MRARALAAATSIFSAGGAAAGVMRSARRRSAPALWASGSGAPAAARRLQASARRAPFSASGPELAARSARSARQVSASAALGAVAARSKSASPCAGPSCGPRASASRSRARAGATSPRARCDFATANKRSASSPAAGFGPGAARRLSSEKADSGAENTDSSGADGAWGGASGAVVNTSLSASAAPCARAGAIAQNARPHTAAAKNAATATRFALNFPHLPVIPKHPLSPGDRRERR